MSGCSIKSHLATALFGLLNSCSKADVHVLQGMLPGPSATVCILSKSGQFVACAEYLVISMFPKLPLEAIETIFEDDTVLLSWDLWLLAAPFNRR